MKKILFIILILLVAGCSNKSPQSEKAFISYMNILQEKTISVYMILSGDKQWILDSIDKNDEFTDIINHKIF